MATQDLPGSSDSLAVKSLRAKRLLFCPPSGLLERTVCSEIFIARAVFNNTTTLTCCWKFSEWPSGKYETMCCLNSQPSHKQTENQWMTSEKQVAVWNISFLVLSFFYFLSTHPARPEQKCISIPSWWRQALKSWSKFRDLLQWNVYFLEEFH